MPASIRKKNSRQGSGGRGGGRDDEAARLLEREIIGRYAARDDEGNIRRCGPRNDEDPNRNWRWSGNNGRPVFKDPDAAAVCARQLEVVKRTKMHAYQCPRSTSGHWHVAPGNPGGRPSRRHPERLAAP